MDTLPENAPEPDDGATELDRLVAECVERFEAEGPSAIEAICAGHPEKADALRRRLDFLESAGLLTVEVDEPDAFPERLGDFRLIEPLGGGGMGIVYLAEQESLGREVALKLVRPEQLYFPGSRERFEREVLTIAQLHHPGIVPVYSVGEQDGVPFFAMERVRGCTLAEVLAAVAGRSPAELTGADFERAIAEVTADDGETPGSELFRGTWEDTCLRIVREVCEALEHAHRRDVLHRDVKPSNIMVTRTGRVLLLDFGLTSTEDADRITRTGSQVGSLPYLAPDYLSGRNPMPLVSHDVYAIGVTLYELLTLELPFAAPTATELQRKILEARPKRLRSLHAKATWEVETVCERAMDPDATRRYTMAADLARDLTNVLERRPIEAQRAGVWLRGRRWAQRHPASAVAAGLGTVLVVGGPTVFAILESRHSANVTAINEQLTRSLEEEERQRTRADQALGEAERANTELAAALGEVETQRNEATSQAARATANFERALGAVDRMLARVGADELAGIPETLPVRTALMDDAIELYRSLAKDNGSDSGLRSRIADALMRLAAFSGVQQQYDRSEASVRAQIAIDLALADELERSPERASHLARAARGLGLLGQLLELQDRVAEAVEQARGAVDLMQEIVDREPTREAELALAHAMVNLGALEFRAGQLDASLESFALGIDVCSGMLVDAPDSWEIRHELSRALDGLGAVHFELDQPEEAESFMREAIALQEELLTEDPTSHVKPNLVGALRNLASVIVDARGDDPDAHQEAEALLRRALAHQEAIVATYPAFTHNHSILHDIQVSLATRIGRDPARAQSAEALLVSAIAGQREIASADTRVSVYTSDLSAALGALADLHARSGRFAEARSGFEEAIAEQTKALEADPDHAEYRRSLALLYLNLAGLDLAEHEHARAAENVARALEVQPLDSRVLTSAVARLAACVESAAGDDRLAEDARSAAAESYARMAGSAVRRALETGTVQAFDDPEFATGTAARAYADALDG